MSEPDQEWTYDGQESSVNQELQAIQTTLVMCLLKMEN